MIQKKIWLMGGIGNNLFQIFLGYILEKKNYRIHYVSNLTKKNWVTKFLGWTIHDNTYRFFLKNDQIIESSNLLVLLGMISKKTGFNIFNVKYVKVINTSGFEKANNFFGYFQDKLFLKKHEEEFHDFCSSIHRIILSNNPLQAGKTVVHFRGGDSLWAKENLGYYLAIKKRIKYLDMVEIISDDLDAAKIFFGKSKNYKFSQSTSPLTDFQTIVLASNIYCAPSTFSWWAAHCALNAKVIAPKFLEETIGYYICENNITLLE